MENIVGVTDYLRDVIAENGGDPARETMTVLRTERRGIFHRQRGRRMARVPLH